MAPGGGAESGRADFGDPANGTRNSGSGVGEAMPQPPARTGSTRTGSNVRHLHVSRHDHPRRSVAGGSALVGCLLILLVLPSCAALQSLTALSQVRFELDRVSELHLAGVRLDDVRSYEDLSVLDAARIGSALVNRTLPLDAIVHVGANNPGDNPEARLLALDWTLFLRDRETVSGVLDDEVVLPSGQRTDVPVGVRMDLLEFFDGGTRELVDLALALGGVGQEPVDVRLEALPTIQTRLGPIRYSEPLVLSGRAGGR